MMKKSEINKSIGTALRQSSKEILSEWGRRVKAVLDEAKKMSSPVLMDHLPEVLENLAVALGAEVTKDKNGEVHIKKLGKIHGRQRNEQTDYSLDEVLEEYSILRKVILEKLWSNGSMDLETALFLHESIDKIVQASVVEFVNLQNEKLQTSINQLNDEKSVREKFVAMMSHDLRTPLTAARMSAQIILKRPEATEVIFKHLPRIVDYIDRIDQMIQDLLDASLVKAGGSLALQFSQCDLDKILSETLSDLIAIHGPRFPAPEKVDIKGFWSSSGIRRILENLCNNAIKYGSQTAQVKIKVSQEKDNIIIAVHNEGTPIPESEAKNLFQPFQRSTSAVEGGKKGWGLGLTLVKGLVEAHGGKINVDSRTGDGTTFIVVLPIDSRSKQVE